jgi:hypothetical protein
MSRWKHLTFVSCFVLLPLQRSAYSTVYLFLNMYSRGYFNDGEPISATELMWSFLVCINIFALTFLFDYVIIRKTYPLAMF